MSGCLGLRGDTGGDGPRVRGFSSGDGNYLKLRYVMVAQSVNILKIIELYALNGWTVWGVNFIS